jgi:hypothetical protein
MCWKNPEVREFCIDLIAIPETLVKVSRGGGTTHKLTKAFD